MKKVIALLLVGTILTVSLCGCSKVRDFMTGTWIDDLFSEATDTKDTGSGNGPLVPADTTAKDTTPGVGNWGEDTSTPDTLAPDTDSGSTDTGNDSGYGKDPLALLNLGDKELVEGYITNSSTSSAYYCYYTMALDPGVYLIQWEIDPSIAENTSPYLPTKSFDGVMKPYFRFTTNYVEENCVWEYICSDTPEGLCYNRYPGCVFEIKNEGDVMALMLFQFNYKADADIDAGVAESRSYVKAIRIYRSIDVENSES